MVLAWFHPVSTGICPERSITLFWEVRMVWIPSYLISSLHVATLIWRSGTFYSEDMSHFFLVGVNPNKQSRANWACWYVAYILAHITVRGGLSPAEGFAMPNCWPFPTAEVAQPCFLCSCLNACLSTPQTHFRQNQFKVGRLTLLILSAVI